MLDVLLYNSILYFLLTGTNFLYVVTHEIGHALGLFHNSRFGSIMEPFVKAGLPYDGQKLPNTDAHTIQDLYSK